MWVIIFCLSSHLYSNIHSQVSWVTCFHEASLQVIWLLHHHHCFLSFSLVFIICFPLWNYRFTHQICQVQWVWNWTLVFHTMIQSSHFQYHCLLSTKVFSSLMVASIAFFQLPLRLSSQSVVFTFKDSTINLVPCSLIPFSIQVPKMIEKAWFVDESCLCFFSFWNYSPSSVRAVTRFFPMLHLMT